MTAAQGTMSALGVRALAAALTGAGVNAADALARARIDIADIASSDGRVPLPNAFALFDLACELTGDPHFGVHAARLVPPGSMEAVEYAIRSCATAGDGLAALARFYAVVDDRATLTVTRSDESLTAHYTPPPGVEMSRSAKEFLFGYIVERGRSFTGSAIRVLEVRFRHAEPPGAEVQRAYFDAPIVFDAGVDELVFGPEVASTPMAAQDPGLSGVLGRVLEKMVRGLEQKNDLLHDVKSAIGSMLTRGMPAVDEAAKTLGVSGRTLQRRLKESGTSFSDLVATVQRDLSLEYLRDRSLSAGEVAYLVGFADTTSFHRAFRRWTGETPSAARRAPSIRPSSGR